jgi:hypothetical protein
MLQQKFDNTVEEEFSRISLDTKLAKTFPTFATSFLDKKIADIKKKAIDSAYINEVTYSSLDPFTGGSKMYPFPLSIPAWNIETAKKATFKPSQTVTISFSTNDIDDDRTVLQYRKTTDKEWKLLSKGQTAYLQNAGCDATDNDFLFLFTSTYHPSIGTSAGITFSVDVLEDMHKRADSCQQPPPTGPTSTTNTTTPTNTTTDQCLIGNWSLDTSSMQSFLTQTLSTGPQTATISNLVVTGAATFDVTPTFSSTMTFSHLPINYDGSASGMTFHTDIDIDGSVTGDLVAAGNSTTASFTWGTSVATGEADTTTTIDGDIGGSIPFDIPISGQYGNETVVQYVCSATSLKISGYIGGKYTWGYTWVKS